MKLGKHEHVVGAWAEYCAGPGWTNSLVWVCIRDAADGRHYVRALQPDEQDVVIRNAFSMYAASSAHLMNAVEALLERNKLKEKKP